MVVVLVVQRGRGRVGVDSAGDVVGDEAGVVADTVDEVGVAAVLEALAERRRGPATGVTPRRWTISPLRVEDRDVEPRVGAAVAGGPDDRRDAVAPAQVERVDAALADRSRAGAARRRAPRGSRPWCVDVGVDPRRAAGAAVVGGGHGGARSSANVSAGRRRRRSAGRRAARRGAAARRGRRRGGRRGRRAAATPSSRRLGRIGPCRRWSFERADPLEPPADVHAPVAARHAAVAADGEHDLAAGAGAARRRAARRWPRRRRRARRRRQQVAGSPVARSACSWWTAGSSRSATAGTRGRSHQPVAITTLRGLPRRVVGDARSKPIVGTARASRTVVSLLDGRVERARRRPSR